MVLGRLINEPATMEAIGFPGNWDADELKSKLKVRRDTGARVFNPAYIVTTCGKKMDKLDYVVDVATTVHFAIPSCRGAKTLAEYFGWLRKVDGLGAGFLAAQVIADLKYTPLMNEERCPDWWTWCTPGPGSLRGMNRLVGADPERAISEPLFRATVLDLRTLIKLRTGFNLDPHDVQNCLCEFDKYMRALDGGRPKQNYAGC